MPLPDTPHLRIALRGGIGSGKSAVGAILRDLGAVVIDADTIGHEVLEPEGGAFVDVASRWPEAVIDGHIDRRRLAAVVFTDGDALAELERMTHPAIAARIAQLAADAGDRVVVVELPLLASIVDEGWLNVIIDAPEATRLARATRRGMREDDVRARMANQPGRAEWLAAADSVISNTGTLDDLAAQVRELWDDWQAVADA